MEAFLFIDFPYNIQFFGASSPSRLKTATRKTGPRRRFHPSRRVTFNYNFFSQKFKERAQFPDFSDFYVASDESGGAWLVRFVPIY
jgi:hypothetical protein